MRTRAELLTHIETGREEWRALLAEVGLARMEEPGPMGEWTFKDLVAHLCGWRERLIRQLENGPDQETPTPWPATLTDDDEVNVWIYERNRDRPLGDVLAEDDASYTRLAAAIAALPDDALTTPGRFAWMGGGALVDGDFFGHLHEEHMQPIRDWLASL